MKNEEQWTQLQRRYRIAEVVIWSEYFLNDMKKRMYLNRSEWQFQHGHKNKQEECIKEKKAGNIMVRSNAIDVKNGKTVIGTILYNSIDNKKGEDNEESRNEEFNRILNQTI